MNQSIYAAGKLVARGIFFCTMRVRQLRPEIAERAGGYVLALTHQGHLDPFCSATLIRRRMRWLTRKEFYKHRPLGWLLDRTGAIKVNRQGISAGAIRRAVELARAGEVIGICPEGGTVCGGEAVFRGGAIKRGVCSIAIRAGVPIVPCVMLGTHALSRVKPWLPFKHARLWVVYGQPIDPPEAKSTRATRDALAKKLSEAFTKLYREANATFGFDDGDWP